MSTEPTPLAIQSNFMCLALSGGGIRSGAVSLGALQELQVTGRLSGYTYISAVSGGEYPVYGLIYELIRSRGTMSELLAEDSSFVRHADTHSDMISLPNSIYGAVNDAFLLSYTSKFIGAFGGAWPHYEAHITRTFAEQPSIWAALVSVPNAPRLADVTRISLRGMPSPIFVTSANEGAHPPKKGHEYVLRDVYELSPTVMGAPNFGYTNKVPGDITVLNAVAASASAIDTPQGSIRFPEVLRTLNYGLGMRMHSARKDVPHRDFNLEDGGFIDNIGIMPLLRHGCSKITIFDNSDDLRPFEAWFEIKARLEAKEEPGWSVAEQLHASGGAETPSEYSNHDEPPSSVVEQWKWHLPTNVWNGRLGVPARGNGKTGVWRRRVPSLSDGREMYGG
jgi:hypothetical protein